MNPYDVTTASLGGATSDMYGLQTAMEMFSDPPLVSSHTNSNIMSHDMSPDHRNLMMDGNVSHNSVHQQDDQVLHGDHGEGDLFSLLNFGNASSPHSCHGSFCFAEQVIVVTVPFLIIFGNVIAITVLINTKSFRNCHGYYLLSLAVADLLMGFAALTAIFPVFKRYWSFGVTGCFLSAYTGEVCMKVSLMMLLLLSLERYIAICHPFHYTRLVTTRKTVIFISLSWALCNLIYILTIPTGIMCFTYASDKYMCTVTYFMHPQYVISVVMTFLLPSIAIVTITSSLSSYQIFQSQIRSKPSRDDKCEMRVHSMKNKRVFRVLITVLLTFYVCWLPYVTINIYACVSGNTWDLNHYVEFYSYWLAVTNSCLNPMIYFGMNKTFKRATVALMQKFVYKITFPMLRPTRSLESIVTSDIESKMTVISTTGMKSNIK